MTDNDVPELTVTIVAASFSEGAGAAATTATVSRVEADMTSSLGVLITYDATEVSLTNAAGTVNIPSGGTVTIIGGSSSVDILINSVNDNLTDGVQTVVLRPT